MSVFRLLNFYVQNFHFLGSHPNLWGYIDYQGKETYTRSKDNEETTGTSHNASPSTSNSAENYNYRASQDINSESLSSVQAPEYEDSEPGSIFIHLSKLD